MCLCGRGSVCNVLLTSCADGICRVWSETLLPEDSLLGGQISENSTSVSSSLPNIAQKDKIQHALEVSNTQHVSGVSVSEFWRVCDNNLCLRSVHPSPQASAQGPEEIVRPGRPHRASAESAGVSRNPPAHLAPCQRPLPLPHFGQHQPKHRWVHTHTHTRAHAQAAR